MINIGSSDDEIVRFLARVKAENPRNARLAADLASVFASSGKIYRHTEQTADVASTGGPSSLSTLLCPLFLRTGGLTVPKLGVPGRPAGGIDCLAQIDGYRTELDETGLVGVIRSAGYAHFLAAGRYAPLDARVFTIRQKHGFQVVPTLVAASLLSKKLAVGVINAGLDVRVAPHGNFGRTMDEANGNAELFREAGELLNLVARPILTDGSQPYQPYIGRGEALVALADIFDSNADEWLNQHLDQCRILSYDAAPEKHRPSIKSASRAELRHWFIANLEAQGTNEKAFELKVRQIREAHTMELVAQQDGFVRVSLEKIRHSLVNLQTTATEKSNRFPDAGGIHLKQRPGAIVSHGDILATVRLENGGDCREFLRVMGEAISVSQFDAHNTGATN